MIARRRYGLGVGLNVMYWEIQIRAHANAGLRVRDADNRRIQREHTHHTSALPRRATVRIIMKSQPKSMRSTLKAELSCYQELSGMRLNVASAVPPDLWTTSLATTIYNLNQADFCFVASIDGVPNFPQTRTPLAQSTTASQAKSHACPVVCIALLTMIWMLREHTRPQSMPSR